MGTSADWKELTFTGSDPTIDLKVPEQLGPYKLKKRLGTGGMGEVWLGFDVMLEREVAIKVMRPELIKSDDAVKRFHREARAVAKLSHTHIVHIYAFGEERGVFYFAMELVKGETVSNRIKTAGPLPLHEAALIVLQSVEGLGYAWNNGVVHRDIKPGNLMLTSDFSIKITDFGLARIVENDSALTQSGTMLGSPSYMSPEQARGREADHRSDIYSLGISFYQMLTRTLPFQADSPLSVLMMHVNEDLPEPPSLKEILDGRVLDVIKKMTAKDPDDRYQTYGGVAAAVSSLVPSLEVRSSAFAVTKPFERVDVPGDLSASARNISVTQTALADPHGGGMANVRIGLPVEQTRTNVPMVRRWWLNPKLLAGAGLALAVAGAVIFVYWGDLMPGSSSLPNSGNSSAKPSPAAMSASSTVRTASAARPATQTPAAALTPTPSGPIRTPIPASAQPIVVQLPPGDSRLYPLVSYNGYERGARNRKIVALGIYAAGGLDGVPAILQLTSSRSFKASFFFSGETLRNRKNTDLIKRVISEGHYVGIMSDKNLEYATAGGKEMKVSREQFDQDVTNVLTALAPYGLNPANVKYAIPNMLHTNNVIGEWYRQRGLTQLMPSSIQDSKLNREWIPAKDPAYVPCVEMIRSALEAETKERDHFYGAHLMLHTEKTNRPDQLYDYYHLLVDELIRRGYSFVRVDEMFGGK